MGGPRKGAPGAAPVPAMPERAEPTEKQTIDITGGALLSKLVKFTYQPSERDPFISSEVVSPFVTEEDLPELLAPDRETLNKARAMIEKHLIGAVEIHGVSSQATGPAPVPGRKGTTRAGLPEAAGYAVGNNGQILRPGRGLLIPVDTKTVEEMRAQLLTSGLALGVEINGKVDSKGDVILKTVSNEGGFSYLLETLRVEIQGQDRKVIFLSPVIIDGETDREISKEFEGTKKILQVGEIPVEQ